MGHSMGGQYTMAFSLANQKDVFLQVNLGMNVHGFLPESDQLLSADQFCHQVAGDLLIPFSNEIQITFI